MVSHKREYIVGNITITQSYQEPLNLTEPFQNQWIDEFHLAQKI